MIVLVNVVQHAKIRLVLTFRAVRLGVPIIYNHQSCLPHRNQEKHHVFGLIKHASKSQQDSNTKLGNKQLHARTPMKLTLKSTIKPRQMTV